MSPRPPDNRRAQQSKGFAEMAILCVLRSRPHYGLELLERINADGGLELADGTIYPLLHRLERSGQVASQWATDTPNGRPRKYYTLTALGRSELSTMLAEWRALRDHIDRLAEGDLP